MITMISGWNVFFSSDGHVRRWSIAPLFSFIRSHSCGLVLWWVTKVQLHSVLMTFLTFLHLQNNQFGSPRDGTVLPGRARNAGLATRNRLADSLEIRLASSTIGMWISQISSKTLKEKINLRKIDSSIQSVAYINSTFDGRRFWHFQSCFSLWFSLRCSIRTRWATKSTFTHRGLLASDGQLDSHPSWWYRDWLFYWC